MTRLRLRRRFVRPWYVPTPGEDGDEMAFFFDGVTYTAGTLTAGTGTRAITVELTLSGAAITSGTGAFAFVVSNTATLDENAGFWDVFDVDGTTGASVVYTLSGESGEGMAFIFCTAADGHCDFILNIGNTGANAANAYILAILPSGGIDISTAISIPGVGE